MYTMYNQTLTKDRLLSVMFNNRNLSVINTMTKNRNRSNIISGYFVVKPYRLKNVF